MATYEELRQIFTNGTLRNKIEVACVIAAEGILNEDAGTTNHANRLVWAKSVLTGPQPERDKLTLVMIAANKGLAVGSITDASDANVQSAVDNTIDLIADGS